MKVRASVKRICKNCKVIRRRRKNGERVINTVRIECTDPRHKQRQG